MHLRSDIIESVFPSHTRLYDSRPSRRGSPDCATLRVTEQKNKYSAYCDYNVIQPGYEHHEGHVSLQKIYRHDDAGLLPPNAVNFAVNLSDGIINLYD